MPVVQVAYDYYPFGMLMPGRYIGDTSEHCTTMTETQMVPAVTRTIAWWGTGRAHAFGGAYLAESYTALIITTPDADDSAGIYDTVQGLVPGVAQTIDINVQSCDGFYRAQVMSGGVVLGSTDLSGFGLGGGSFAVNFTPPTSTVTVEVITGGPFLVSGTTTTGTH